MADATAPTDTAGASPLPISHDAMFKAGLRWPGVLLAILEAVLPRSVTRLFAGEPEAVDASFLNGRLVSRIADLVFRIPLATGAKEFVFILLEHKSEPVAQAALQVRGYAMALWELLGSRAGLPLVIPLLVYCGEREWKPPLAIADLLAGEHAVARYARRWARGAVCRLVDLVALPLKKLEKSNLAWAFCALMRGAMRPAEQERLLPGIFARLPEGSVYESQALCYVLYRWRLDGDQVRGIINSVKQSKGDRLMQSWGERYVAERVALGKAEGKAEMLLKAMQYRFNPVPAEAVARVNGASAAEIDAWSEAVFEAPSLAALLEG